MSVGSESVSIFLLASQAAHAPRAPFLHLQSSGCVLGYALSEAFVKELYLSNYGREFADLLLKPRGLIVGFPELIA